MSARPLVVVVDDDESVRESLPHLLGAFGFAVEAFSSAEECLAANSISRVQCLVLDVAMSGMGGRGLQEELRRRGHATPIVFITAHEDDMVRGQLLESGAVGCLFKPFTGQALRAAIDTALRPDGPGATPVVFVVDDDVSMRESLEALVRWGGWKPETFDSAHAFLARPADEVPSCLILDVELPDLNGLDLQQRLTVDRAGMPIIFLTGHGDIPMSVRAMKAGAAEFLTKPFDRDVLLRAIGHALDTHRSALARAADMRALRERYLSLTRREREVCAWVVAGTLNKQIGAALGMTEATVKAHRGQVMQKMRADSLADLVRIAGRLNLPLPSR